MKIVIAEDDQLSCRLLETRLGGWGYEVVVTHDGDEAWSVLQRSDTPQLAVLDWMMPGLDGVEVCRKVREIEAGPFVYILLLTAKMRKEDVTEGLEAGADDYIVKPFDVGELRSRVRVGVRMVTLHNKLTDHVRKLEEALANVKQLEGLLPICSYCKKIRDDKNYWKQVDHYMMEHTSAKFSHGICPDCYERIVKTELNESRFDEEST